MISSVFEHPILSGLFTTDAIAGLFTAEKEIEEIIRFEIALAETQGVLGIIPQSAARTIQTCLSGVRLDLDQLRTSTAQDGVLVPNLVQQLRQAASGDAAQYVHYGATSQDAIDTSLMCRLKEAHQILSRQLSSLIEMLDALCHKSGARPMTAYTRMQPAIEFTVADKIDSWIYPLKRHLDRLETDTANSFWVQLGGAVGNLNKYRDKAAELRQLLAESLGLIDRPQWHTQRDQLLFVIGNVAALTGSLGKFGQDIAMLAEIGDEITLSGGGGSSAMPHKKNPISAEMLVTLARYNAVQMSAMHHAMIHEQERSGSSWMLEWMVVPSIYAAAQSGLFHGQKLVMEIVDIGRSQDN